MARDTAVGSASLPNVEKALNWYPLAGRVVRFPLCAPKWPRVLGRKDETMTGHGKKAQGNREPIGKWCVPRHAKCARRGLAACEKQLETQLRQDAKREIDTALYETCGQCYGIDQDCGHCAYGLVEK